MGKWVLDVGFECAFEVGFYGGGCAWGLVVELGDADACLFCLFVGQESVGDNSGGGI